jgi:vacuolar protein sorting-associated protein 72
MPNKKSKDAPLFQGDNASVSGSESGSESNDDSDVSQPVETLIAGRDRRATAGNRMANLIEREEDDEVSLLFAQEDEEEDVEFEGSDEDASDAQLDSSSDDEDQGPNTKGFDDLEGEKELQREDKAQKARKRKAQDAFTTVSGLRKKVKIDPPATSLTAPPRPKKKSERVSWLPDVNDGPTRASARKQTVENKEVTHLRLKDHAVMRAKRIAQTRKAEREREKYKPKQVTQEDRMAEAAKTEKKNSKSLNRWEETERKRADEQAAKLAALKNRKLDGPVASWWSGIATWIGTKLTKIGTKETSQEMLAEPKKRGRKPKLNPEAADSVKEDAQSSIGTPRDQTVTPAPSEPSLQQQLLASDQVVHLNQPGGNPTPPAPNITFAAPQGPDNFFLQGIQEYASMPSEAGSNLPSTAPSDGPSTPHVYVDPSQRLPSHFQPPVQPEPTYSTRNLVMLANFESIPPNDRGAFGVFYNTRKGPKLSKVNQELCPITSLPARYRDPSTGVAYANPDAYKKLEELKDHRFIWSGMLGCYVGTSGVAARGVPDGFLSGFQGSTIRT